MVLQYKIKGLNMGTPEEQKPTDSLSTDVSASDDKGNANKAPEGVDYKALFEQEQKRAKDNQAAFTKKAQELSVLKKEHQVLEEQLSNSITLPAEQTAELDKLKFSDPDAWYKKRMEYENLAIQNVIAKRDEARQAAYQEVTKQSEEDVMTAWLSDNPEITLDMINLDVPQRIHKQKEEGTLTAEEFLEESKKYLTEVKKTVKKPETNDVKDLNKVPGGTNPTQQAVVKQQEQDAKLEIY